MIYYITKQIFMPDTIVDTCSIYDSLEELSKYEWISVDSETTGLCRFKDKLLSIQLGNK